MEKILPLHIHDLIDGKIFNSHVFKIPQNAVLTTLPVFSDENEFTAIGYFSESKKQFSVLQLLSGTTRHPANQFPISSKITKLVFPDSAQIKNSRISLAEAILSLNVSAKESLLFCNLNGCCLYLYLYTPKTDPRLTFACLTSPNNSIVAQHLQAIFARKIVSAVLLDDQFKKLVVETGGNRLLEAEILNSFSDMDVTNSTDEVIIRSVSQTFDEKMRKNGEKVWSTEISEAGFLSFANQAKVLNQADQDLLATSFYVIDKLRESIFSALDDFPYRFHFLPSPEKMFSALTRISTPPNQNALMIRKFPTDFLMSDFVGDWFMEDLRMKCSFGGFASPWELFHRTFPVVSRQEKQPTKTPFELREEVYSRGKECNSFNPAIMLWFLKYFYRLFSDRSDEPLRILDPSGGWGDRLIASLAFGRIVNTPIHTITNDPNPDLLSRYEKIVRSFARETDESQFLQLPFEDVTTEHIPENWADFSFTSPPFGDLEIYKSVIEDSLRLQSSTRYPDYESWKRSYRDHYLRNMVRFTKPGGIIGLYVGDFVTDNAHSLTNDSNLSEYGCEFLGCLRYAVEVTDGEGKKTMGKMRKVFCWKKGPNKTIRVTPGSFLQKLELLEFQEESEPNSANSTLELRLALAQTKSKLSEHDYRKIKDQNPYVELRNRVVNDYKSQITTNAWLKCWEFATSFLDVKKPIRLFANAELPGAFISALNHFSAVRQIPDFDWRGSSLFSEEALGDEYGLVKNYPYKWLMSTTHRGDVTSVPDLEYLIRTVSTFRPNLYTSDIGMDVSQDYNSQEELHIPLHFGQLIAGLLTLAPGGTIFLKTFTFFHPRSHEMLEFLHSFFENVYVYKPITSRFTNSETYIVGINLLRVPNLDEKLRWFEWLRRKDINVAFSFGENSTFLQRSNLLSIISQLTTSQIYELEQLQTTNLPFRTISAVGNDLREEWLGWNQVRELPIVDRLKTIAKKEERSDDRRGGGRGMSDRRGGGRGRGMSDRRGRVRGRW